MYSLALPRWSGLSWGVTWYQWCLMSAPCYVGDTSMWHRILLANQTSHRIPTSFDANWIRNKPNICVPCHSSDTDHETIMFYYMAACIISLCISDQLVLQASINWPQYNSLENVQISPEDKLRSAHIISELTGNGHFVSKVDMLLSGTKNCGLGLSDWQSRNQGPDTCRGGSLNTHFN